MKLSEELAWRGLIKDKTFSEPSWLDQPQTFYLGIDASADSLTVGNLAIILLARRLAAAGWQAYLVMGGGTSLVGDPGGKTEERQLMSRETVENNITSIKQQVTTLFSGQDFKLVDNYDWLSKLNYLEFLRDVGKHFSMTELMQREFVTERMGEGGSGISYAEFSYSLVQGYDFWHLLKQHGVVMQIGGSDQWGNLLSGVALIRKKEGKEGKEAQALSMPLVINKTTGEKFGKSAAGAIWLDAEKTSPTQFYQFWINVDDESAESYLKVFTELSKEEIDGTIGEFKKNKAERLAQKTLAFEVTKLVHGDQAANDAETASKELKGQLGFSGELSTVLIKEMPKDEAFRELAEVLVNAGLAESKSEARRLLESGGIYINNEQSTKQQLEESDFNDNQVRLRRGKTLQNTVIIRLK
jgi:tyrosyl-tRNA synthetase